MNVCTYNDIIDLRMGVKSSQLFVYQTERVGEFASLHSGVSANRTQESHD